MVDVQPTVQVSEESENTQAKYGLLWPANMLDVSIELKCYLLEHPTEKGGLGKEHHFRNAVKMLYPANTKSGSSLYEWHYWTDRRVAAWCDCAFATWWGPAASAKSTDAALFSLVDWYADPEHTTVIICSTTLNLLKRRIFGEIARFHRIHEGGVAPGTYIQSKTRIMLDPDTTDAAWEKAGIFGFAVQQGDEKSARDNIIGQHNSRVRLIIDEAQDPSLEVAFSARANLRTGCPDFKLLAFGNPNSRLDPLGRYSEPAGGWDSISDEAESWDTKLGKCFFFDGRKSPALKEPDRLRFLINQHDFDEAERDTGKDSPDWWQFCVGFVRPDGTNHQIISEVFAIRHKMQEAPDWAAGFKTGAGFDPAFSNGGDARMLAPFCVGYSTWGRDIISFLDPIKIVVEVSLLDDMTATRQTVVKAIDACKSLGIEKQHFGLDTTGAQDMMADVFDESWDDVGRVWRCSFGGKASSLGASAENNDRAYDVYANKVTELWFNVVSFAKGNQIRNLPSQALREFTLRELVPAAEKKMRGTRRQIETKPSMKKRTGGRSPDTADACCVGLDVVRHVFGVHPLAFDGVASQRRNSSSDEFIKDADVDADEDLYLTNDV